MQKALRSFDQNLYKVARLFGGPVFNVDQPLQQVRVQRAVQVLLELLKVFEGDPVLFEAALVTGGAVALRLKRHEIEFNVAPNEQ
jgi:hypothetical protein